MLEQLTGTTEPRPYEPPAGLIGHVRDIAPVFEQALDRLAARHDVVALTRGVGVMRALELRVDAAPIVDAARGRRTAGESHGGARRSHAAAADGDTRGDRRGRRAFSTPFSRPLRRRSRREHATGRAAHGGDSCVRAAHAQAASGEAAFVSPRHQCRRAAAVHADRGARGGGTSAGARFDDLTANAARFTVAEHGGTIIGCAELAPLSGRVAEVRSLVVDASARGLGIGRALVTDLEARAAREDFASLCAFTHDPRFFVRLGFSLVPHAWVPEKIAKDCVGCPQFRQCGQSAVVRRLGQAMRPRSDAFVPLASLRS